MTNREAHPDYAALERLRPIKDPGMLRGDDWEQYRQDQFTAVNLALRLIGPDAGEAITGEWLRSVGAVTRESQLGPDYADCYGIGGIWIYRFNSTDDWVLDEMDRFNIRTRGQLRRLCSALGITLEEANAN